MKSTSKSYKVVLYAKAYQDLEEIYKYISFIISEPLIAKNQTNRIWDAINSLSLFPYSHQDRLVGRFADKGYKQLVVDNYLIVYKIDESLKQVFVVRIQYIGRDI